MNLSKETIAIIMTILLQTLAASFWAGQVTARLSSVEDIGSRVENLEGIHMLGSDK